jgi:uncharacterized alkaline shock family protein YloU
MLNQFDEMDTREIDLPDTIFIRDIESRVFQSITVKCLSGIQGISLLEGTIFDNLLGREGIERIKGVYVEQDSKNHAVHLKVELNIAYGLSIPEKAEEIQGKLVEEITKLTGLHVACVHVVFKSLIADPTLSDPLYKETKVSKEDEPLNEYPEEF